MAAFEVLPSIGMDGQSNTHNTDSALGQMECREKDSFHNQPFLPSMLAFCFSVYLLLTCGLDLFVGLCQKQLCVMFGDIIAE